jgi:hypothetical protein
MRSNPTPYFCESCGQLSGTPIQISNYQGKGENKDVCFDCMRQELERVKAEKRKQREEERKKGRKRN